MDSEVAAGFRAPTEAREKPTDGGRTYMRAEFVWNVARFCGLG